MARDLKTLALVPNGRGRESREAREAARAAKAEKWLFAVEGVGVVGASLSG